MRQDPVCNTDIGEVTLYKSVYEGKEYWFDSLACKNQFDMDPEKYMGAAHEMRGVEDEAGEKVRETGSRAARRTEKHAREMLTDRKGEAADLFESISGALYEASKNLHERRYEDTASVMERLAGQSEGLSSFFRDKDTGEIIGGMEEFVRNRPALAIGGALAAGFIFSRILKSEDRPGE